MMEAKFRTGPKILGAEALRDNSIIARDNNYGLSQDTSILIGALTHAGQSVSTSTPRSRGFFRRFFRRHEARRIIHVERVFKAWLSAGDENVVIPNQERFPRRLLPYLTKVDHVFAKTRHAAEIFGEVHRSVVHLGFTSRDRFDANVRKDWRSFLHLAGGNTLKGTEDILNLWSRHPEWPELILVQKATNAPRRVPENVRLVSGYLSDAELRTLQNGCGVHLCPSRAEGWGHHIVEALSCGAVTVTTDAPPMNEHVNPSCGVLLPVVRSESRHLGTQYFVDIEQFESAIIRLIDMADDEKQKLGARARSRFLEIDAAFKHRVLELI